MLYKKEKKDLPMEKSIFTIRESEELDESLKLQEMQKMEKGDHQRSKINSLTKQKKGKGKENGRVK